jgi:hypothetical protein
VSHETVLLLLVMPASVLQNDGFATDLFPIDSQQKCVPSLKTSIATIFPQRNENNARTEIQRARKRWPYFESRS